MGGGGQDLIHLADIVSRPAGFAEGCSTATVIINKLFGEVIIFQKSIEPKKKVDLVGPLSLIILCVTVILVEFAGRGYTTNRDTPF